MNIVYIGITVYTLLKTMSFFMYKIKEGNILSFVVSLILTLALLIISVIYYI